MSEPRIGDAERDVAIGHLREAFADGQLDQVEYEQRLKVATRAKVGSELEPLLSDLPIASLPVPVQAHDIVTNTSFMESDFWTRTGAGPVLMGAIICTVIYAMTNLGGYFWPMWVWLGVVVTVLIAYFADD